MSKKRKRQQQVTEREWKRGRERAQFATVFKVKI